jgi:hypothetical protein
LTAAGWRKHRANPRKLVAAKASQNVAARAFAQILGKLYFLQFGENLQRILFDYGQKHRRRTNAAFNAAC